MPTTGPEKEGQAPTVRDNTSIISTNANCFYLALRMALDLGRHALPPACGKRVAAPATIKPAHQIACKVRVFARQLKRNDNDSH